MASGVHSTTIPVSFGCANYNVPIKWIRVAFLISTIGLAIILFSSYFVFTYAPAAVQWTTVALSLPLLLGTIETANLLQSRFRFLFD